ncbi:MAG TPA: lytic transglycosylase domain-containing protein [Anaeromyxobacteraceae bacterium]|nr:lytic transglycosylase domain-containing protein [Anaeromyxobacteraceae bacterium]
MTRPAAMLLLGTIALAPVPTRAGEMCSYRSADGVTVFTNVDMGSHCRKRANYPSGQASARKPAAATRASSVAEVRALLLSPTAYRDSVRRASERYNLPEELIHAVMSVESGFRPDAVSSKGAAGLMQLMPGTAKDMYVRNVWDSDENIQGGARYLRILANQYDGDLRKTLAAYNAGPDAVKKAGGVPNFPETQDYVRRVLDTYQRLKSNPAKG